MISPGMLLSDRYEIIDRVGTGGMADVYKARDQRLNRYVAIKILKQEYSNDAKFVSKFRGEAQSVAGLSHPNIVNVYDVGEDDDFYYIVMELVEGITLKKFIEKKGHLDVNESVGIAVQIASGMQAAHDNHIIHRDIKPQNIIISKEGKVKVTDFGIAKAATSNTITSNAMGSVHYISPEQARGGYSDEKSDIYSLGVTMYEMLSGRVPFEGDSTVSVALAHIQEEAVPLQEVDPDIPRSLSRIVLKCMQKKPDMRYMCANALVADLKRSLSEPDGDYVMIQDVTDASPTIVLSTEEVNALKGAGHTAVSSRDTQPRSKEEPEEEVIDPKLERIIKICSAVVAVIIVFVIILCVMKVAGLFGGKSKAPETAQTPVAEESATPSVTPGSEMVEIPELVGHTLEEAQKLLADSNLRYETLPVESEEEANQVTKQEPEAGESVEEYTTVKIYYSQGKSGVIIPDITKQSKEDAMTTLQDLGLTIAGTTETYSDSIEKGLVCGSDPVIGSSVEKGTAVTLLISKGPKSETVKVPNIVNKKLSVAQEKLSDLGLQYPENPTQSYSDTVPAGRVISQAIKSGTRVDVGTVVEFTVSLGPKSTPAPEPTKEAVKYDYIATVKVNQNPFDYEDEPSAVIKLVLDQDGKSQTVRSETMSYSDFPHSFSIEGWSDNNGKVTLYKDNVDTGISYNVEFKKVAR